VEGFAGYRQQGKRQRPLWACRCNCGNIVNVVAPQLVKGHTTSCGCKRKRTLSRVKTTHGRSRSAEYRVWCHMRARCADVGDKNYGGRGISVCERWADFTNFLADMGERPGPQFTIERKDNAKGYLPDNCEWATRATQNKNTRKVRKVEWNGSEVLVCELARRFGINSRTFRRYLDAGRQVEAIIERLKTNEQ
jgi:hypothetical protein